MKEEIRQFRWSRAPPKQGRTKKTKVGANREKIPSSSFLFRSILNLKKSRGGSTGPIWRRILHGELFFSLSIRKIILSIHRFTHCMIIVFLDFTVRSSAAGGRKNISARASLCSPQANPGQVKRREDEGLLFDSIFPKLEQLGPAWFGFLDYHRLCCSR
jgi:hypothetical protein